MITPLNRIRLAALLAAVSAPATLTLAQTVAPVPAQPTAKSDAPKSDIKPAPAQVQAPIPMPAQPPHAMPDAIKIDQMKFDWGDISDTEPVEHAFTFTNISDKEITLAVSASCGCTVPTMEKTVYKAGETGKVTARFDPHNRQGPQTKNLTFTVINPQGVFNQQVTTLTANVKALVVFDPPKMFLSEVDHSTGQNTKVTVTGRKEGFKVESVTANSEFVKAKLGDPTTSEVNGEKLTSVPIELTVGKGAPIGTLQAQVDIKTNDERAKLPPYFMGADVVGDIKASPAQAILRVNDPSSPFSTQIKIDSRSGAPFNILSLETDARKEMHVVTDFQKADDGNYYMVTISGVTPGDGGMVQSSLIISTDAKGGETIKVPFTAVIRKPIQSPGINATQFQPSPKGTTVKPMPMPKSDIKPETKPEVKPDPKSDAKPQPK